MYFKEKNHNPSMSIYIKEKTKNYYMVIENIFSLLLLRYIRRKIEKLLLTLDARVPCMHADNAF
jgi:hypothetical protein